MLIQDKLFKAAFRRLRRMKTWKDRISGALCGYEFTLTPTGWHYHAHIIALRKTWYDQAQLAQDWQRATRTSTAIVDIRAISNLSDGLRSTLQYCFKPIQIGNWTSNEITQVEEMKGVKLSDCFGTLRGLQPTPISDEYAEAELPLSVGSPCPECGDSLDLLRLSCRDLDKFSLACNRSVPNSRAGPSSFRLLSGLQRFEL